MAMVFIFCRGVASDRLAVNDSTPESMSSGY